MAAVLGSVEGGAESESHMTRRRGSQSAGKRMSYLRAMAELGPGHRSGDIAAELGRQLTSLGPTRNQLIAKGMVWSLSHGDTAFTAPLFDEFMRRVITDPGVHDAGNGRSRSPKRCSRSPIQTFTIQRSTCSRWADLGVHGRPKAPVNLDDPSHSSRVHNSARTSIDLVQRPNHVPL